MASGILQAKKAFFDIEKVLTESDRVLQRGLSKLGAYIRRTAQFSMKSRKGASPPGTPPYAHGNKFLKKFIFFGYDKKNKSMVVGPTKLERTKSYDVPRVEEKGEVRSVSTRHGTIVKRYPARSSIQPAAEENLKKLSQIFSMNRATRK